MALFKFIKLSKIKMNLLNVKDHIEIKKLFQKDHKKKTIKVEVNIMVYETPESK